MTHRLILTLWVLFVFGDLKAETNGWQPAAGLAQTPIWPGRPPDAVALAGAEFAVGSGPVAGRPILIVSNVSQPTMTVYGPKGTNTGVAVVVFPGGGYRCLAIDLEGTEICDWLAARGITAVLLKYRAPTPRVGPYGESRQALEDAQRTLALVRFHAVEWKIDPRKIGVMGFSAGGHLVTAVSTHFDRRAYPAVDAADSVSCRPDFAIALYPGHLWDEDAGFKLNPNIRVSTNTPPTFLLQAENDPVDNVNHSLVYYIGLKNAGVPVEMHLYAEGGHGFGLRATKLPITGWPRLVEAWLGTIGIMSPGRGNY